MASIPTGFVIRHELRLCKVNNELGYFHCWEHYSKPVPAGLTIGSPPAGVISYVSGIVEFEDDIRIRCMDPGVISYVSGIVEFEDGVRRVDPTEIKFCDEEHADLCALNKYEKERCKDEKK